MSTVNKLELKFTSNNEQSDETFTLSRVIGSQNTTQIFLQLEAFLKSSGLLHENEVLAVERLPLPEDFD